METTTKGLPEVAETRAAVRVPGVLTANSPNLALASGLAFNHSTVTRSDTLAIAVRHRPRAVRTHGAGSTSSMAATAGGGRHVS